jgi:hypothetical protein
MFHNADYAPDRRQLQRFSTGSRQEMSASPANKTAAIEKSKAAVLKQKSEL